MAKERFDKHCYDGVVKYEENGILHVVGHRIDPDTLEVENLADIEIWSKALDGQMPENLRYYDVFMSHKGGLIRFCYDPELKILEIFKDNDKSVVFSNFSLFDLD